MVVKHDHFTVDLFSEYFNGQCAPIFAMENEKIILVCLSSNEVKFMPCLSSIFIITLFVPLLRLYMYVHMIYVRENILLLLYMIQDVITKFAQNCKNPLILNVIWIYLIHYCYQNFRGASSKFNWDCSHILHSPIQWWSVINKWLGLRVSIFQKKLVFYRSLLLFGGGLMLIFGSRSVELPGSGPLGCLTMAFVCALRWRQEGWTDGNVRILLQIIIWLTALNWAINICIFICVPSC